MDQLLIEPGFVWSRSLRKNDTAVFIPLFVSQKPDSDWLVGVGGGVRGSNFGLVLVSIALWEINVVADPVISSAC